MSEQSDNADRYLVVCLDEGVYFIATRRVFATRAEAEVYAQTVAESRIPLVIAGRFHQLRFPDYTPEDRSGEYDGTEDLNDARASKPWDFGAE